MLIVLASSDKLALGAFSKYLMKVYEDRLTVLKDLNVLFSRDIQLLKIKEFKLESSNKNVIVKYVVRPGMKSEQVDTALFEEADVVFWFDLYATHPVLLKDCHSEKISSIIERWDERVKKLDESR